MSSDKILAINFASFEEAKYIKCVPSNAMDKVKYIVNPKYAHINNRVIIINLPIEVKIELLKASNRIISRFPIPGIHAEPYELPNDRHECSKKEFSTLILNKYMLDDLRYLDLLINNKFLLGIDTIIDGAITLVGYVMLKNKIEQISNIN